MKRTLGERVANARLLSGLTQRELAGACGVTKPTISRIEADVRKPSLELLRLLARELGVTADHLLEGLP